MCLTRRGLEKEMCGETPRFGRGVCLCFVLFAHFLLVQTLVKAEHSVKFSFAYFAVKPSWPSIVSSRTVSTPGLFQKSHLPLTFSFLKA